MNSQDNINNTISIPQPEEVNDKDRENGFGAYIMMFASAYFPFPFVEIISSLIYYFYFKKRSRYVTFHAYQSFLVQIPVTILNSALTVYGIVLLVRFFKTDIILRQSIVLFLSFLTITIVINIIYIIVSLVIAFKAKKGIFGYFPFFGRIAFEKLYGQNAVEIGFNTPVTGRNRPPE